MIRSFDGDYRFLSNFVDCEVDLYGLTYRSVEHAYVAAKTDDPEERTHIRNNLSTSGKAKRYGRKLRNRDDWDNIKYDVMCDLVRQKFNKSPFKEQLLYTQDCEIFEGNRWGDYYWGVVWNDDGTYKGENNLGKIIMQIRTELNNSNLYTFIETYSNIFIPILKRMKDK